jgi:hypothetical protein
MLVSCTVAIVVEILLADRHNGPLGFTTEGALCYGENTNMSLALAPPVAPQLRATPCPREGLSKGRAAQSTWRDRGDHFAAIAARRQCT